MKNFFISDLHFWHTNILYFDQRPWNTTEEMNQALIDNWNSVVTDDDRVYMLGDFSWGGTGKAKKILEQLNGRIIWIIGNHDPENESFYRKLVTMGYIEEYHDMLIRWIDGYEITMCHYPMACYKHDSNDRNLMFYGHLHNTHEQELTEELIKIIKDSRTAPNHNRGQLINVGCMMPYMNYTPQTTEYIVSIMDKWNYTK